MKVKILGGFKGKTKKGNDAWFLSVVPESNNDNNIGIVTRNLVSMSELDISSMLNKTYLLDVSNNFINGCYPIEEKR